MNRVVKSSPSRVLEALSFREPDVPPLALSLALQASRVARIPLPDILTDPVAFSDAQLLMHKRWQHDVTIAMRHAAVEAEAFGAPVHYFCDGPPNVASMLVASPADIRRVRVPRIETSQPLLDSLEVVSRMKQRLESRALVAGVAVGPLSGPVMLAGMEKWFDLLFTNPPAARELIARYNDFSYRWASAQLAHGADLIVWFEPLASREILPLHLIEEFASPALHRICRIGAPIVFHTASARSLGVIDMAVEAGAAVLSIGRFDDLDAIREAASQRITLIGPLDGIGMQRWTVEEARDRAREATRKLGGHGGFILSDAHGEIPYQVPPTTLDALVQAIRPPPP